MLRPLALVLLSSLPAVAAQEVPTNLDGLDAVVERVRADWKVPGLAVAVVRDDAVLVAKGYGVRDVETRAPVTTKTLFAIGSISKSFTTTGLSILADEGKLDWDAPVRDLLPEFRLADEHATRAATVRDLVTHRVGLPRHDRVWYRSGLDRPALIASLRHLEPNRDLRAAWQYNNLMYLAAGVVAERLSGRPWEDFTRKRIFRPLGMTAATFSVAAMQQADDFARPHGKFKGGVRPIPFADIDAIGPAGSINAPVDDMARYLRLHLNRGRIGETRLVSEAAADRMRSPQMVIADTDAGALHSPEFPELGHLAYGLGFFVTTYRGREAVWHSGSIDGFSALMTFLPRERVGVVVLCNLSGNRPVPVCVTRYALDRLLGLEPIDWATRAKAIDAKAERETEAAREKARAETKTGTRPSHGWGDYAGTFEHPVYGRLRVDAEADGLALSWRGASTRLAHRHYDVFDTGTDEDASDDFTIPRIRVSFATDPKGVIDRLSIPLEPKVADIAFRRVGDAPKDATIVRAGDAPYDLLILGGKVVDGTGNAWFLGDVAVRGDRVAKVAPAGVLASANAKLRIDAKGMVVAPGFIDIQAHSREQLLKGDSRLIGKVTQGVTTEILGEGTSNAPSEEYDGPRGFDAWLAAMEARGVSVNVGSFLGSASVRSYVKGMTEGPPTAEELVRMKSIVREAIRDGAFGLASALIYPPDNFVATDDLIALCREMAPSGGLYITHMRSEGDRLIEGIDEALKIGREAGVPVEIYHLKAAGRRNWSKAAQAIAKIEEARAAGQDVAADMYPYTAGGTGLTACLPPWASAGGKLYDNLDSPEARAKIRAEIERPKSDWENLGALATPEGTLVLGLKKDENKAHAGKRLSEIAAARGKDWIDTAMDLLLSERQRIDTIYFLMSEENVKLQLARPWMKIGTDAGGHDPETASGLVHPRSYGTYPRILGKYVREERVIPLEDAVRKMTSAVADRLSLRDRGQVREGFHADLVVFDPETIGDRATFEKPHQLSVGVRDVFVNGRAVVRDGAHTGAKPGRVVRGPGYRRVHAAQE